ncbi:AMP-binding protein, partial [bacterium]|nr:AMP-binding protein [bacterium]
YLGDREATIRAVRAGWYDTGDLGHLDEDGFLWLSGRLTRCVKVGGEMVSLWRVEQILSRHLPQGAACCVVGVPDDRRGTRIAAVVTCDIDERAVAKNMASELPRVAIPKVFVRVDDIPTLGGSKVDFRAAGRLAAASIKEVS